MTIAKNFKKRIGKISFKDIFIILLLIFSEYTKKMNSKIFFYFYIAILMIFFIFSYYENIKNLKIYKLEKNMQFIVIFPIINILLITIQSCFLPVRSAAIKRIIENILFLILIFLFDGKEYFGLKKGVKVISFFLMFDMIIKIPIILKNSMNFAEIRYLTILDKGFYTFWLCLLNTLSLLDILYNKNNDFLKIISLIIVDLIAIIFMELKTLIFLIILIIFIYFITNKEISKKKKLFVLIFFIIFCIIFYISYENIEKFLPNFIINLNKYLRYGLGGLQNIGSARSYFMRAEILNNCKKLVKQNPFGIGFGNYYYYAMSGNAPILNGKIVSETESSYLNLIVEGGIVAFLIDIMFMIKLIIVSLKNKENNSRDIAYVLITLILLNIINDFMTITYWIVLGCIVPYIISENLKEKRGKHE